MSLTPSNDPNGLAAAIVGLATAVLAAIDPSGTLGARWTPVVLGVVAVGAILAARRKTVAPATHESALAGALEQGRRQGLAERPAPAPAKRPAKKAAKKAAG